MNCFINKTFDMNVYELLSVEVKFSVFYYNDPNR